MVHEGDKWVDGSGKRVIKFSSSGQEIIKGLAEP